MCVFHLTVELWYVPQFIQQICPKCRLVTCFRASGDAELGLGYAKIGLGYVKKRLGAAAKNRVTKRRFRPRIASSVIDG